MGDLSDRIVLLTGASQGIGASTVPVLAVAGASIVAHHRGGPGDRDRLEQVLQNVPAERRYVVSADYADDTAVDEMWRDAVAWKNRIDTVILNAAMMRPAGGIEDEDPVWHDAWAQHYQVNVQAPARLMRSAVRHFRAQGGGVIILMSSWVAQRGVTNPAMLAYAASKSAIKAVAQSIARSYASDNILVYIIAPGIVRTKMSLDFAELQGGEEAVTRTLAMQEWVPPREIGEIVAFLATGRVKHLSGATLDVNGATYIR